MPEDPLPLYSDGFQITCNPYTVSLSFTVSPNPSKAQAPPALVADIRMSPEHVKVMTIILKRHLREFEQQLGHSIPIHPQVAQQLGISPNEDW